MNKNQIQKSLNFIQKSLDFLQKSFDFLQKRLIFFKNRLLLWKFSSTFFKIHHILRFYFLFFWILSKLAWISWKTHDFANNVFFQKYAWISKKSLDFLKKSRREFLPLDLKKIILYDVSVKRRKIKEKEESHASKLALWRLKFF